MSIRTDLSGMLEKKQVFLFVPHEFLSLHNFNNWTLRKKGTEMD